MRIAFIILLMPWFASITGVLLATLAYVVSGSARRTIDILLLGESALPAASAEVRTIEAASA